MQISLRHPCIFEYRYFWRYERSDFSEKFNSSRDELQRSPPVTQIGRNIATTQMMLLLMLYALVFSAKRLISNRKKPVELSYVHDRGSHSWIHPPL